MRLQQLLEATHEPRENRFRGWKKAALIGLLLPWVTACNYTFVSEAPDGGGDGGPDSQVDAGTDSDATPGNCGNGTLNDGEQCDDGNLNDGDGCSSGCLVECCSGSTQDCNYTSWGTQNLDALWVDPAPPAGFCQCAGFVNTPEWDVAFDWEANCLGINAVLRVRYWDTATTPWTLLGDSTLSPASRANYDPQTFDAIDHGGTEGILETQGFTLLKDDPDIDEWFMDTCDEGGHGYYYSFNDMTFANRTNDKVVHVCSASSKDACLPEHELRMADAAFGFCVSLPHHYDLAIAIYRQNQ